MSEKWATESETSKYFKWVSIHPSKQRMFDGLTVSALGGGSLSGASDDATDQLYEQILLKEALGGINFFDTSPHYRNMRSEKVLGKVMRELMKRGIPREQFVIATKGGYLPFEGVFEDYVRSHFLDTRIIEPKEIVAEIHCMAPSFLGHQIQESLNHLGLQTLDLYCLHNPEIQIQEVGEAEFYSRLKKAFALFEQKVGERKIRRYGISSWNGFRVKKGGLDLEKVLACAREIGGNQHHFKAILAPYNLVMLEILKNEKMFQMAREQQVAFLVFAPFMQGQIRQMPKRVFESLPPGRSPLMQALEFVLSTPGICTSFCGMKSKEHWEENRQILQEPNWSEEAWEQASHSLGCPAQSANNLEL